jgi:hypothetical protein
LDAAASEPAFAPVGMDGGSDQNEVTFQICERSGLALR